ncbi:MAG: hypothetical protein E6K76_02390 [Candidatus Eisenbacteria bacterium]|uniref:Lipoprotein n=1 Tax=Eiseniibacteriota bacterium TaxID=2212470 RepID=A0A538T982_UNCEI|nr:MAG: hypothetical protein E6K76_02390 [Candidatus Eisenbacteria bacterium]
MKTKDPGTKRRAIVVASAALAFLALGCGEHKEQASVAADAGQTTAGQETPKMVAASATGATTPEAGALAEGDATALADSLPPDVTVFAPDSLVVPGSVVEITAQASPDVTAMTLTDRLGQKHGFLYDAGAKAWRVYYRIPIRTDSEQLGLSVTATNGANRWKRVWVFLKIQGAEVKESEGL